MSFDVTHCTLCPRQCGADRTKTVGYCHCGTEIRVARAALHPWEEPCISGETGSGTVFFAGCTLGCCFCQNREISRSAVGKVLTVEQLADTFLRLQAEQACNINLVTGSHYTPWIVQALELAKPQLKIPVVWNCGGYESPEILAMLDGLVDIYLPDLKFYSPETAKAYANCPDYFETASKAIMTMFQQVGALQWNGTLLERGLIVRHLVLPGHRKESMALLDWLAEALPKEQFLLSLMGQYTPPDMPLPDKHLNRRAATFEYESVREHAVELGLNGYGQERSAAAAGYIPAFEVE
ncbi:radical SAM protein [Ruminococcus sp.]|uniref:radical SAM protein n=1 Tax=Ruminococcus sp. TaxID=41978 RepID=UPI0025D7E23B|nr:radical SAM protein [Ruminococcus sp.]